MDLIAWIVFAFLPACPEHQPAEVWGCQQVEPEVTRANFNVGQTGHYVEVRNGEVTVHQTYGIDANSLLINR